ncbi:MAG TPA: glutamine synthetase family protein [Nocardioides sp.]|uniref:glutamine synthetase family protein n=1 Tax=uncultured Nocardioides sp. TaxID=198441 RepID=UPI00262CDC91|nr:glutamine synthetase family protein [uncultured Nocardioides sp.]HRI94288.1 glutamine synthetase family protein [Nocardioides sp.]HRK44234.1 glutamine synthetase family protein [Nocardioides sp.]
MSLTTDSAENASSPTEALERIVAEAEAGRLKEVEILWSDHQGHPRGKRIPVSHFLDKVSGPGVAFCDVALAWDVLGDVVDGMVGSNWDTGMPDIVARPDLQTFRYLPWRPDTGLVLCDLYTHHGNLVPTAPRTVLHRAVDTLAELGYTASVGVEIEFYLLDEQGKPLVDGLQAYSLERANAMEPVFGALTEGLRGFVDVEAGNVEYGPAQCEFNIRHADALCVANEATAFRYAVREIARRAGAGVTFMSKPFNTYSGSSMHLHVSLWRDGEPAMGLVDGRENDVMRHAAAGILANLPGQALFQAPTVNSYRRYEPGSFAPTTSGWSVDNRTTALRSLREGPTSTRLELRTPGADAEPHWAIASLLAAVALGLEDSAEPPEQGTGNMYGVGAPLPVTLVQAIEAAEANSRIVDILGKDAVSDYATLARAEWQSFISTVSDWDAKRYLHI